jgi:hypothetical protein
MASTYYHLLDTSGNTTGNANPYTTTYTCGLKTTGCTLLVLGLVYAAAASRIGGSPTYNSVTMTQANTTRNATETSCEMWYLIDPTSGVSYTLSIPNTNTRTLYVTLSSYSTLNPRRYTSVLDTTNGNSTTSINSSLSVTTTYNGSLIVQTHGCGNNSIPTSNNKTLLFSVDRGNFSDNNQYELQTTAGTTAFTWNFSNDDWCSCMGAWRVGTRKREFHIT